MTRKSPLLQLIGVHMPPNAPGTHTAKMESITSLEGAMTTHSDAIEDDRRKRLAIGDFNSKPGQKIPGPTQLAEQIHGKTAGNRIDCAVYRNLKGVMVTYHPMVGRVQMRSDHKHAVRATFWANFKPQSVWFYNLQVGRPDGEVAREVLAIMARRPLALVLCEATGHGLPNINHYSLIRDRSRGARANMAMYVRRDRLEGVYWLDQSLTWARTEHPGTHDPRSYPVARVRL